MFGVAVVAVLIAGEQARRRWVEYRSRANFHAVREQIFRREYPRIVELCRWQQLHPDDVRGFHFYFGQAMVDYYSERIAYHAELKRKYDSAVMRPWVSVQ